jgi:hypothetical protein
LKISNAQKVQVYLPFEVTIVIEVTWLLFCSCKKTPTLQRKILLKPTFHIPGSGSIQEMKVLK